MEVLARQQEIERERVRIAGDLHDELASNLTSIAMLSTVLHGSSLRPGEQRDRLDQLAERISGLSTESVDSIRDIIWAIDPKDETFESLLTRLADSVVNLCRPRGIQLTSTVSGDPLPTGNLQPEFRRDLWLLLKEAANNALKHSGCTELLIAADVDQGTLRIVVQDNGKGYDLSSSSPGKGFRTMTMRAARLNGILDHRSSIGGGTTITLTLTLPQ
jgi:signal transduction histidine kinase